MKPTVGTASAQRYCIIEELWQEEGETRLVYGIAELQSCGSERAFVHALTADRREAESFLNAVEDSDLSPLHLKDFAEDWVTEQAT